MTETNDPDGESPILSTEQSASVPCLWEVGAGGRDHFTALLPWWPQSLYLLELEGWGGVPLRERRLTGREEKVKEDWFGPRGKDRKALTPIADLVFVQLKAALLR